MLLRLDGKMKHESQRSLLSCFSGIGGALISAAVLLTGCGVAGDGAVATQPISTVPAQGRGVSGILHGGPNPVSGSNVILWATQSNGYPSSTNETTGTTSLQLATTTTSSSGAFSFTAGSYACPSGQFAYITATGGNSGAGTNNQITMMSALGPCSHFDNATDEGNINIYISEVTTVAAAYALGNFMYVNDNGGTGNQLVYVGAPANNNASTGSCTGTGSSMTCTAAGLAHAFANAANLVDAVRYNGTTPTGAAYTAPPSNPTYGAVPAAEINALANILISCTNSTGGTTTGACGNLFAYATPVDSTNGFNGNVGNGVGSSNWAKLVNGTLSYETTAMGDHIMDFSSAGYMGGGVALPTSFTVQVTLQPGGGYGSGCPSGTSDDTCAIQAAINSVPSGGGEVVLAAGTFHISSTIDIYQSGVVLSGSGSGSGGTTVQWTGSSGSVAFQIGQTGTTTTSNTVNLTQSYIPSGSMSATVSSTSGFTVGQEVLISRPSTAAWIQYMGMTPSGSDETWMNVGSTITTDRTIAAINTSTNTITFNAPITDSFNSTYLGSPVGTLSVYTPNGLIQNVGLQHLEILAPSGVATSLSTLYSAVNMQNVLNGWIYDVVGQETQGAFVLNKNTRQITLEKVINNVSVVQTLSTPSADFAITGTQIFVDNCQSNGTGDWPFVTQSGGTGPIAVLNFSSTQNKGMGGHQRWTTGLLIDNATLSNAPEAAPGIVYENRGLSEGQGWAMGWSVAWNVTTPYTTVSAPPGTENWCIGCQGALVSSGSSGPNGIYDSLGTTVTPKSLYLDQLYERLGQGALTAIGYGSYQP